MTESQSLSNWNRDRRARRCRTGLDGLLRLGLQDWLGSCLSSSRRAATCLAERRRYFRIRCKPSDRIEIEPAGHAPPISVMVAGCCRRPRDARRN
jgi:hypothetical protein